MNKKNGFYFVLVLFFLSCSHRETTVNTISDGSSNSNDSSFNFVLQKFGLLYPENYKSDSNSLTFYSMKSFDSSFLIHLKRTSNGANGVYYIDPAYNQNENSDQQYQSLFFEGYSFILDSAKWEMIKNRATELLKDTSFKNSAGCRDCIDYGLSYNFKIKVDNGIKYESFYEFLKKLVLNDISQSRKRIMNK